MPTEGDRLIKTKKIACTFYVKLGHDCEHAEKWCVVESGTTHTRHGRLSPDSIGSLPAARHYLKKKRSIVDLIKRQLAAGVTPRSIWASFRREFEWLVYEDVDNKVPYLCAARLGGTNEAEALHKKLQQDSVVSDSLRDEDNRLTRLFFAVKVSQPLVSRYPNILMIDATYRTKKHKMPLLHVVVVTGTNNHFSVAIVCWRTRQSQVTCG